MKLKRITYATVLVVAATAATTMAASPATAGSFSTCGGNSGIIQNNVHLAAGPIGGNQFTGGTINGGTYSISVQKMKCAKAKKVLWKFLNQQKLFGKWYAVQNSNTNFVFYKGSPTASGFGVTQISGLPS